MSDLPHFERHKEPVLQAGGALAALPRWRLLAGDVEENASDVVVCAEVPSMNKDDC